MTNHTENAVSAAVGIFAGILALVESTGPTVVKLIVIAAAAFITGAMTRLGLIATDILLLRFRKKLPEIKIESRPGGIEEKKETWDGSLLSDTARPH